MIIIRSWTVRICQKEAVWLTSGIPGYGRKRTGLTAALWETGRRMEALGLTLRVEVGVAAHLAREGFDPASGARPLRRRIQRLVEERVAEELLAGRLRRGDGVKVGLRENELAIEREKE